MTATPRLLYPGQTNALPENSTPPITAPPSNSSATTSTSSPTATASSTTCSETKSSTPSAHTTRTPSSRPILKCRERCSRSPWKNPYTATERPDPHPIYYSLFPRRSTRPWRMMIIRRTEGENASNLFWEPKPAWSRRLSPRYRIFLDNTPVRRSRWRSFSPSHRKPSWEWKTPMGIIIIIYLLYPASEEGKDAAPPAGVPPVRL
mmetsp:Transcript_4220/g.6247  ORF Transcript_4220/g.6247 Transcript_4220/m.6247 type:complete len:205 (+) Transcript_4220:182-796(+)